MKVKELIEELSKHNSDYLVGVSGYEGGIDIVGSTVIKKISPCPSSSRYDGTYEENPNGEPAIYLEIAERQELY